MRARRPLLWPLVPLYRVGVWLSRKGARRDAFRGRLRFPVISVGSISAGGAGKTPFTMALARLLHADGYGVSVLSRGYGRTGTATLRVDPEGTAATFGDEPLMMARTLGIPVYVDAQRERAARLAEQESLGDGRQVHLLDDGFSHHRLRRAIDTVLLTKADLDDALIPAGNLREPIEALERADILVLRADEQLEVRSFIAGKPGLLRKPRWMIERRLELPTETPRKPLVFSAVGRPADFEAGLLGLGVQAAATRRFPDHHRYTHRDVTALCTQARQAGADGFVTTAKDEVKMSRAMRTQLGEVGPVTVAQLTVELLDAEGAMDDLRRLLASAAVL